MIQLRIRFFTDCNRSESFTVFFNPQLRLGIYTQHNILEKNSNCTFKEFVQVSIEHSPV